MDRISQPVPEHPRAVIPAALRSHVDARSRMREHLAYPLGHVGHQTARIRRGQSRVLVALPSEKIGAAAQTGEEPVDFLGDPCQKYEEVQ